MNTKELAKATKGLLLERGWSNEESVRKTRGLYSLGSAMTAVRDTIAPSDGTRRAHSDLKRRVLAVTNTDSLIHYNDKVAKNLDDVFSVLDRAVELTP
jgi:hypothetical protein